MKTRVFAITFLILILVTLLVVAKTPQNNEQNTEGLSYEELLLKIDSSLVSAIKTNNYVRALMLTTRALSIDEIKALKALGVIFESNIARENIYIVRIRGKYIPTILRRYPSIIDSFRGFDGMLFASWDYLADLKITEVWRETNRYGDNLTGKGAVIGLIDSGVDWKNPLFFKADGDEYYPEDISGTWMVKINGTYYNLETIDLNNNSNFDIYIDYLFADLDGDTLHDFPNSSYWEPMFVVNDTNHNGALDDVDVLIELKTCKVKKYFDGSKWISFGSPEFDLKDTYGHGTSVASAIIGGQPGLNRQVLGAAPDADLYVMPVIIMNDTSTHTNSSGTYTVCVADPYYKLPDIYNILNTALKLPSGLEIDVLVIPLSNYFGLFLDGRDALDVALSSVDIPIIVPAGNYANSKKHAFFTLSAASQYTLDFDVPTAIATGIVNNDTVTPFESGTGIHRGAILATYDSWDSESYWSEELPHQVDASQIINFTLIINKVLNPGDIQIKVEKTSLNDINLGDISGDDSVTFTPTGAWGRATIGGFDTVQFICDAHEIWYKMTVSGGITKIDMGILKLCNNFSSDTQNRPEWRGEYIQATNWRITVINNLATSINVSAWIHEIMAYEVHGTDPYTNVDIVWNQPSSTYWTVTSPGMSSYVLTVGSYGESGSVSTFSSRYPIFDYAKPDVMAPGENIPVAIPGEKIMYGSGTSYAAALVAGIAGIIQQVWKSQKGERCPRDTMYSILRENATNDTYTLEWGWGKPNANQSVDVRVPYLIVEDPPTYIRDPTYSLEIHFMTWDHAGDMGVEKVEIRRDDVLIKTIETPPMDNTVNISLGEIGWHTIEIRAIDWFGNLRSYTASIHMNDSTDPIIDVALSNGTVVQGLAKIPISITDNYALAKVEIYINGTLKDTYCPSEDELTEMSFEYILDTQAMENGIYIIEIVTYDTYGNNATYILVISVQNPRTPPPSPEFLVLIGVMLGAVVGIIIAAILIRRAIQKRREEKEFLPSEKEIKIEKKEMPELPMDETETLCWQCGRVIKKTAKRCPYCGAKQ